MNEYKERKSCKICGREFEEYKYRNRKYCLKKCASADITNILGKKEERACVYCGKTFLIQPARKKRFCCTRCMYDHRKGKPSNRKHYKHTEEIRRKISETKKGQVPWNKGKGDLSQTERDRNDIRYEEWRESIFKRDDYTCQKCKRKGYILHPHHIKNFAQHKKDRFNVNNGITLCKECHYLFHNNYGYRNNNKKQIKEFLQTKLKICLKKNM